MKLQKIVIGLAGVGLLLIGAVWFFFIRSDAPPEASLEDAVAAVGEDAIADTGSGSGDSIGADGVDGLDGAWVVDQGLSFVGYRITEELASIGATTAVGRTSDVVGTLTFAGTQVTELSVSVDMTTLQSDRSRRDSAMRTRGLETDTFSTAAFVLSEPIELGAAPREGETVNVTAVGELTVHGTANTVSIDFEGSLVEGTMVVVGSADVVLTDYAIEAPTGFSVVSIADTGTIELQLAFVRG
ncbi:MAG: YceI family protein [Actinomycetota bacterium]|nr:YceI family protein [Actinomycetota bacterium]